MEAVIYYPLMWKKKHLRQVRKLAQGHTDSEWQGRSNPYGTLVSKLLQAKTPSPPPSPPLQRPQALTQMFLTWMGMPVPYGKFHIPCPASSLGAQIPAMRPLTSVGPKFKFPWSQQSVASGKDCGSLSFPHRKDASS